MEVQLHAFLTLAEASGQLHSFIPQPLYPQGKSPQYSLGGLQSQSGHGSKEKNPTIAPVKNGTPVNQSIA